MQEVADQANEVDEARSRFHTDRHNFFKAAENLPWMQYAREKGWYDGLGATSCPREWAPSYLPLAQKVSSHSAGAADGSVPKDTCKGKESKHEKGKK